MKIKEDKKKNFVKNKFIDICVSMKQWKTQKEFPI